MMSGSPMYFIIFAVRMVMGWGWFGGGRVKAGLGRDIAGAAQAWVACLLPRARTRVGGDVRESSHDLGVLHRQEELGVTGESLHHGRGHARRHACEAACDTRTVAQSLL
ncbi:hypothetical protein T492DRAFT_1083209, partial [Pavlovales sp. CCMP2436]